MNEHSIEMVTVSDVFILQHKEGVFTVDGGNKSAKKGGGVEGKIITAVISKGATLSNIQYNIKYTNIFNSNCRLSCFSYNQPGKLSKHLFSSL